MTEVTVASIRAFDAEQWLATHEVPDYVTEYLLGHRAIAESNERHRQGQLRWWLSLPDRRRMS